MKWPQQVLPINKGDMFCEKNKIFYYLITKQKCKLWTVVKTAVQRLTCTATHYHYMQYVSQQKLCFIPLIASTPERTRAKHVFTWRQTSEFQVSNFQVFPPNFEVLLLTLLLDTAQREDDYQKGVTFTTICEIKWKNANRIILSQKLGED